MLRARGRTFLMDRFRSGWRAFCRDAPNGASYVGFAMILVIWLATGFHLLAFKHQL
jgi:hypothetical protein